MMLAADQYVVYDNENGRVPTKTERRIRGKHITIGSGDWQKLDMASACSIIRQWKSQKISLIYNLYPPIILDIVNVSFPHLIHLRLQANNITTIENINKIYLPSLTMLSLNNNKISKLNEMRKMHIVNMSVLHINNNPISQIHAIKEMEWSSGKRLKVYMQSYANQPQICDNLNILLKMKTEMLKKLSMTSERRIKRKQFIRCMKRKYKHIQINEKRQRFVF